MRRSTQSATTAAAVAWYLARYHRTLRDLGGPQMYCDPERMGRFAVTGTEFRAGSGPALLRMLVATTLFQRRQDQQVFRILRNLSKAQVEGLSSRPRLRAGIAQCDCPMVKSVGDLHLRCDVAKDATSKLGTCLTAPTVNCPPKEHAVLLRRYGDFGKVPSSAVLMLEAEGARDLAHLRRLVLRRAARPGERAELLERAVMGVWRVSTKVAAVFLSALSNPDLGTVEPPWADGIAWERYIVIDSNVERFLAALGYGGLRPDGRHAAVRDLAARVRLDGLRPGLAPYNPRIVQQAMYVFMSKSNRAANPDDCMYEGPAACRRCDKTLVRICPVRSRGTS